MTDQILPHIPVIIIGAGQAGLSVSWYLKRKGIDHLVLERHRNFHAWRAHRWDSFCLVTPNWQCRLPDWPYQGRLHRRSRRCTRSIVGAWGNCPKAAR